MKWLRATAITAAAFGVCGSGWCMPDDYKLGPDSEYHDGVPRGVVTHYRWESKIYPGTERDYWIYVPKQYDAANPACVMVFQDGGGFQSVTGQFRVPVVFDNLIFKHEMPVTIAVMVDPGVVPAANPEALPRYNRSYEYDNPTDQYARFLTKEILPEVGKRYNLTSNPDGRALCGASSGGICAFTAAWERPDIFRRVMSFVGSFTDLRGGQLYGSLIRKMEPKPLRVFLQDGTNDQDIYSGSWFIGNQDVAAALKYACYDYQFIVGDGGHNGKHGGAILPDALRWLWRDYPKPIAVPSETPQPVMEVLKAGEEWQRVGSIDSATSLATDSKGSVLALGWGRAERIASDGSATVVRSGIGRADAAISDSAGRLIISDRSAQRLQIVGTDGGILDIPGIEASSLVTNVKGDTYFAEAKSGAIWRIDKSGSRKQVDKGVSNASAIWLSPDQTLLFVAHNAPGSYVYSYTIDEDGALANKQPYFDLHFVYGHGASGASAMACDTQGRLYVATEAGIQICDQAGRVNGIIANPERIPITSLVFGGPELDTLYALAGHHVYRRRTKAKGVLPFQPPVKPPAPRL